MRAWRRLRERILACAAPLVETGALARVEDAFLLTAEELRGVLPPPHALTQRRATLEGLARADVPSTADRDTIEAALDGRAAAGAEPTRAVLRGVGLGAFRFEGRVRRADDLAGLLEAEPAGAAPSLDRDTVLVVPALEPSWAVVFGRVGAVVAELGGELSHASILLREAGKPAVVNCLGACRALADGERVRLDGASGTVERLRP